MPAYARLFQVREHLRLVRKPLLDLYTGNWVFRSKESKNLSEIFNWVVCEVFLVKNLWRFQAEP